MQDLFNEDELESGKGKNEDAQIPEQYKHLSQADLVKALQERDEQISGMSKRYDELHAEVSEISKAMQSRREPETTKPRDEEEVSFYSAPDKAAAQLVDKKLEPYVTTFLSNEEARQLAEIRQLPYAKDEYGLMKEVEATYKASHPEARMRAGAARAIYDYVVGRNLDKIREKERELAKNKPEFTESGTSAAPPRRSSPTLTEDERRVAEGQGLTPEEYLEWRDNPEKAKESAKKEKRQ